MDKNNISASDNILDGYLDITGMFKYFRDKDAIHNPYLFGLLDNFLYMINPNTNKRFTMDELCETKTISNYYIFNELLCDFQFLKATASFIKPYITGISYELSKYPIKLSQLESELTKSFNFSYSPKTVKNLNRTQFHATLIGFHATLLEYCGILQYYYRPEYDNKKIFNLISSCIITLNNDDRIERKSKILKEMCVLDIRNPIYTHDFTDFIMHKYLNYSDGDLDTFGLVYILDDLSVGPPDYFDIKKRVLQYTGIEIQDTCKRFVEILNMIDFKMLRKVDTYDKVKQVIIDDI